MTTVPRLRYGTHGSWCFFPPTKKSFRFHEIFLKNEIIIDTKIKPKQL